MTSEPFFTPSMILFAIGVLRSPRYLATIFSDVAIDFSTSVRRTAVPFSFDAFVRLRVCVDREVDCPLSSNVSNLSSILIAHEVELAVRVVEPDWMYHRITLRINGPQPQRNLRSGEKNVDLRLFHARSIRHRLMHPHH